MASSLPNVEKSRIRLPLILLRRADLGQGAFAIVGDAYEEYVVLVLTGSFNGTFGEFSRRGSRIISIYKPQVNLLLRRFHSLFTLGFGTIGGVG